VKPAVYLGIGTLFAIGTNLAYIRFSGNPVDQFTSSFSSSLLWYRLFPNSTFLPGILFASLFIIVPMMITLHWRTRSGGMSLESLQLVGVSASLLVLYIGGLLVSVKIGGGSNLHNLDALWAVFLVVFLLGSLGTRALAAERSWDFQMPVTAWVKASLLLTILAPIWFSLNTFDVFQTTVWSRVEKSLHRLQASLKQVTDSGGEVLLISERHLLTFHQLGETPLVPEYERVFLMEMVMSGNRVYLDRFHADIRNQRFAIILNEPLYLGVKGSPARFGEENDAWVREVSTPLLCYYKPLQDARMLLMNMEIQLLVPRESIDAECQ
jgi:hypothetical protein